MTGDSRRAGTPYCSGAPESLLVFSEVRIARSFVFCVVFCRSFFILFLLAIVLPDLQILITPSVSSNSS